jgi:hypothetical protein
MPKKNSPAKGPAKTAAATSCVEVPQIESAWGKSREERVANIRAALEEQAEYNEIANQFEAELLAKSKLTREEMAALIKTKYEEQMDSFELEEEVKANMRTERAEKGLSEPHVRGFPLLPVGPPRKAASPPPAPGPLRLPGDAPHA